MTRTEQGLVALLSAQQADGGRRALRRGDAVLRLLRRGWSISSIVAQCGRSRSALYDDGKLYGLPTAVTGAVRAGVLSATSAVLLSRRRADDEQMKAALSAVLALPAGRFGQPSVREVRRLVGRTR